jgi:electron transport complex protein RnfG
VRATREPLRLALRLGLLGLAAVALLEGLHRLSAPRIEAARLQQQREALALALPATQFDNRLEQDWIDVVAPRWLGARTPLRLYRASRGGAPSGWVAEAEATDGYGGPIRMLIGIDAQARIQGVRLTEHRETPGLGDYVDARRSDWPENLRGRSLDNPPLADWRIGRDGDVFPYVAGATLSPRAVVGAVRRALQFVVRHSASLRSAKPGSHLEFHDGP